ncbi:ABC transporter ATP-binding protein/permease [Lentzea flaviverrucosa]|uniref:ATP-binding cassette, subfamily C, CydD n=1 Tax=Lentzea flaviverrucosa TaxID=200379 RepID=A0A1H9MP57_9PSEU|nr:ATP-binding cassette domain-containing protein [Lentzea flaviverrucosa]RDI30840.1 ATP-binding cassette subfamily C protein CydD [Lentzea flaviverrucosa]SER25476.1 ATP-binding cassette, subfamily C, CydD [Lentzea flaviverrucosa]
MVDRRHLLALIPIPFLVLAQAELLATVLSGGTGLLLLCLVIGARVLVWWVHREWAHRAAERTRARLREAFLRSPGTKAGEVATLVTRGVHDVTPYVVGYLPQQVLAVAVPLAVVVRLAFADLTAALTILVTLPLIPIFGALVGAHTRERTARQWDALATLGGHFLDVVKGIGTLRAFGRAEAQSTTVRTLAARHLTETMSALRVAFLSAFVLELVATMSVAMVAVPIGLRLLDGGVPLHTALLVLFLAPEAFLPLRAAGAQYHASAQGREVLAKVPAHQETRGQAPPDLAQAEIVLDGVSVRSLKNFSLRIRPGDRIALVGPSGAGKSTILGLLLGFVRPDHGRVLVGGVDLREIDHGQWLAALSWVPQRPTLVPANLSSGEQQRVALANALDRRRAGLFLLDEPTAHLDAETESLVLEATREFTRGRTAVIVAHRPALLGEVDRVVEV